MLVAKAGSKVIIHGLKNSPEYNGKCGRVVSILPDSKLVVVLDRGDADEKKELKISGQNVTVAPTSSEFFRGGSQLQQNGQHVEALPMFHECLRTAMEDGDLDMACAALNGAAQSCFDLKQYDEAITNFRACLQTSEDSGNVAGQAETLMNIGSVYMEQGLSSEAHESYVNALVHIGRVTNQQQQCSICFQLGGLLYMHGSLSQALEAYELLQGAADAVKDEKMQSTAMINRAGILLKLDRLPDAFKVYTDLLSFAERTGQEILTGKAFHGMGNVYSTQGKTLEAAGMHEKHLAIAKKHNLDGDQATALGNLAYVKQLLGDCTEAMQMMEQDLAIRVRMGDKLKEGEACIGLAPMCCDVGDYERSLSLYERALQISRQHNLAVLAVPAMLGVAHILHIRGENAAAGQKYEEVLVLSPASGHEHHRDTALMGTACCLLDSCQAHEAVAILQQCLARAEEAGNVHRIIGARHRLVEAYTFMGQSEACKEQLDRLQEVLQQSKHTDSEALHDAQSRSNYEQLLMVGMERGNIPLQACAHRNLATKHLSAGNYAESIRCTRKAYELCLQCGDEAGKRASLTQQATTALFFAQFPQAILTIRQLTALGEDSESKTVLLNSLLAEAYVGLSLFRYAIKLYESILAFWEKTRHFPMQGKTLKKMGDSFLVWGKHREALEYYEKGIGLIEAHGPDVDPKMGVQKFEVYGNAGQACFHLGEYEKALVYYDLHMSVIDLDSGVHTLQTACFWTARGQALLGMERKECAVECLYKALERWEPLFKAFDLQDDANVAFFDCQLRDVYHLLIPALVQAGRHEEALSISERSKARAAEQLIRNRVPVDERVADDTGEISVQEIRDTVSRECATLLEYFITRDDLLTWTASPGGAIFCRCLSLAELEQTCGLELDALLEVALRGMRVDDRNAKAWRECAGERDGGDDAECAAARAKALQRARDSALDAKAYVEACESGENGEDPDGETLQTLNKIHALPQYLLLMRKAAAQQKHVHKWLGSMAAPPGTEAEAWAAAMESLQGHRLGWDDLRDLSQEALEREYGVSSSAVRSHILAQIEWLFDEERLLRLLYDVLLLPVQDTIRNSEELIISPHAALYAVPWAALRDADGCYVIESHTVRLVSSLRIATLQRGSEEQLVQRAAVVGNPWPVSSPVRPLPHAEMEAEQVLASLSQHCPLVRTQILTGVKASKDLVKKLLNGTCWAHLACHCLLEDQALVLAGSASERECNMTMQEVRDEVSVERGSTVVLSACSSAMGEIRGEGVLGLSRAFLCSGAAAVVVSLWSVDDYATKVLFRAFYAALQRGLPTQRALQSAMLHVVGRQRKGPGSLPGPPPPSESEGEWRSMFNAHGREEFQGLQLLFNGGKPFTYNGSPLTEGNGVNKRGMVSSEACTAVFGVPKYVGDLWGEDGAVVKQAKTCSEHHVTNALVHFDKSVAIRSDYKGILDTNHSFMLRALQRTVTQLRFDLTQKALEQLAISEKDDKGSHVNRGQASAQSANAHTQSTNPLAKPRLWSAFVIIGASTKLPKHQGGAESVVAAEKRNQAIDLLARKEVLSVDDVCAVLILVELGEHVDAFRQNSIDGSLLGELEQLWDDLGVTKKAHQIKLKKIFALA